MVFMIKLLFRIVRAITLFALCGFAVFLTYEIFLQFQSKDSSFKKSQVPISTLPSISICFDPKNKNLLEYGKDFNISKYNNNNDYLGMAQFRFLIHTLEKFVFNRELLSLNSMQKFQSPISKNFGLTLNFKSIYSALK